MSKSVLLRYVKSLTSTLFQLLSVSDFFTCVIACPVASFYLLKPGFDQDLQPATSLQLVYTAALFMPMCWSYSLTAIMGVVRYISICFPFYHIRKTAVLVSAAVLLLYVAATGVELIISGSLWYVTNNAARTFYSDDTSFVKIFTLSKFVLNLVISIVASILTIWELRKVSKASGAGRKSTSCKSAMTVALMNFGILLTGIIHCIGITMTIVDSESSIWMQYISFMGHLLVPTMQSAWNPLIIVCRSAKIRKYIAGNRSIVSDWVTSRSDRSGAASITIENNYKPTSAV